MTVVLPNAGILVLSDKFYSPWIASIGGVSVPLLRVDGVLGAVGLESGNHIVRFIYRPSWVHIGAAFTLATVGVVLLVEACVWVLKRGGPRGEAAHLS